MNKYEQLQKKMKHYVIFSREIFYVTIVLCLNILWLKAVNEITARQTWTSLCKHDVIKVCSVKDLTAQLELMLPTLKSWTVHRIIEYLALGLLSSLWNIYHSTTAYFFDPPCTLEVDWYSRFCDYYTHVSHDSRHLQADCQEPESAP